MSWERTEAGGAASIQARLAAQITADSPRHEMAKILDDPVLAARCGVATRRMGERSGAEALRAVGEASA